MPWWTRGFVDGRHAHPELERASAELYGRLRMLTDALEQMVREREDYLRDDGDDDGEADG